MEGKVTYNWRELQTYFDCFGSPKEVMAKLDRVSVVYYNDTGYQLCRNGLER